MADFRLVNGSARFGAFELDVRAGELRKHGIKIKLQGQPFQVLQILLERSGEVVTREELQHGLWPSNTFVEFDKGIYNAIKRLRETLGDSADNPRFIETVSKRGYRFVTEVRYEPGLLARKDPKEVEAHGAKMRGNAARLRNLVLIGVACVAALVLAALFNMDGIGNRAVGRLSTPRIQSLAVLPLTNLSSDPRQEYFSDGMTDALITELSHIGSLKVISRTSVMAYRKSAKPLSQIAGELGVNGIVEGTVQSSGDRLRITAQLIYAPADEHVWAKSYEGDSGNALALEQDVAQDIAQEIQAKLTPAEKARFARAHPVSLKALQAYLQGRYHTEKAEELRYRNGMSASELEELRSARDFFEQALREDSSYAQAYVGLAHTWLDRPVVEKGPDNADAALRKAVKFEPDLAEAHEALATLDVLRQWRWSEAEWEYKRAIELNPNFAEAHARYAEYLDCMQRFDEGMKEFLHAQELDPGHSFQPNPFIRRRQYDRAIEIDQNEIKRHAFGFWPHVDLAFDYDAAGKHDQAAQEWEETMRMLGYDQIAQAMHRGLVESGYRGAFRAWVAALETADAQGAPPPAFFPGMIYGILGEKDRAFQWLERGYHERSAAYSALNVDPYWDPLRSDPRFQDLVRRMNFPH